MTDRDRRPRDHALSRAIGAGCVVVVVPSIVHATGTPAPGRELGIVATVVFGLVYLTYVLRVTPAFMGAAPTHRLRSAVVVASLLVLGGTAVATIGLLALFTAPLIASVLVLAYGTIGLVPAAVLAVVVEGVGTALSGSWLTPVGLALSTIAAGLAVWGLGQFVAAGRSRLRAGRATAAADLATQRERFSRDLHDLLGHSLTAITIRAQLAERLIGHDDERARAEVRDIERSAREALADVRRAVEGYRDLSLDTELAGAIEMLEAAGIRTEVVRGDVPEQFDHLFAWAVREGTTNVLRHSDAGTCRVEVDGARCTITDDGRGPATSVPDDLGHGLRGLAERASDVGATVDFEAVPPHGAVLRVRIAP